MALGSQAEQGVVGFRHWMIACTVTLMALMEVLDITIVVVALRDMQGALSASPTEITWTLTVYVVTAAIFMPLTGYLTARFNRRSLLLASIVGFGLSSVLCGFSSSLSEILIFRAFQGACGAMLPSLAQATLLDTFQGKERKKAMAFYGIGVVLGPIIGPILGGYITSHFGWRWIFFINVPISLLAVCLTWFFIPHTKRRGVHSDWLGLLLMAVGVGLLQFVLDKGNEVGWFDADFILFSAISCVYVLTVFVLRGMRVKHHVVNFEVFKDRNYRVGCLVMFLFAAITMGSFSWFSVWVQIFLGYPAQTAGLLILPRGLSILAMMVLTPFLLNFIEARWLLVLGCGFYFLGAYVLSSYNLLIGFSNLLWPNILQGIGSGLCFVPLMTLAYQTLSADLLDTAAGLFNFFRSVGSSVGVAVFSAIMTQKAQVNWAHLAGHLNPSNPRLSIWLNTHHLSLNSPLASAELTSLLVSQSNLLAFNDANLFFGSLCFVMALIVLLLKPVKGARSTPMGH